jgi:hypothetical protein
MQSDRYSTKFKSKDILMHCIVVFLCKVIVVCVQDRNFAVLMISNEKFSPSSGTGFRGQTDEQSDGQSVRIPNQSY